MSEPILRRIHTLHDGANPLNITVIDSPYSVRRLFLLALAHWSRDFAGAIWPTSGATNWDLHAVSSTTPPDVLSLPYPDG